MDSDFFIFFKCERFRFARTERRFLILGFNFDFELVTYWLYSCSTTGTPQLWSVQTLTEKPCLSPPWFCMKMLPSLPLIFLCDQMIDDIKLDWKETSLLLRLPSLQLPWILNIISHRYAYTVWSQWVCPLEEWNLIALEEELVHPVLAFGNLKGQKIWCFPVAQSSVPLSLLKSHLSPHRWGLD